MMVEPVDIAEQKVRAILERIKKRELDADLDTPLYADGIELDSLETAEFSALLEDEFGTDPFSADAMPQTMRDVLAFYRDPATP